MQHSDGLPSSSGSPLPERFLSRLLGFADLFTRPTWSNVLVLLAGGAILALFLVHKLPAVSAYLGLSEANRVLALIGFSYVALRMVEVLRAVFEGRYPARADGRRCRW